MNTWGRPRHFSPFRKPGAIRDRLVTCCTAFVARDPATQVDTSGRRP